MINKLQKSMKIFLNNNSELCAAGTLLVLGILTLANWGGPIPNSSETKVTPIVQTEPVKPTKDLQAADAVRVIRQLYTIGQRIGLLRSQWNRCTDVVKDYNELLDCESSIASESARLAQQLPAAAIATESCGQTIELTHRKYIKDVAALQNDHVQWLIASKAKIVGRFGKRFNNSLWQFCVGNKTCSDEPSEFWQGEGFPKPTYNIGLDSMNVYQAKCVPELFDCDLPANKAGLINVCWINKVADRLGIGEKPAFSHVFVKDTGTVIQP